MGRILELLIHETDFEKPNLNIFIDNQTAQTGIDLFDLQTSYRYKNP